MSTIIILIFIQFDSLPGFTSELRLETSNTGCDPSCRWMVPVIPTGYCSESPYGGTSCGLTPTFPSQGKNCTGTFYPVCNPE